MKKVRTLVRQTVAVMGTLGVMMAMASQLSFAMAPTRGDSSRPGQYQPMLTCTYSDSGWEEHWSGHRSCGECLREHDNCEVRCYSSTYSCTAKGTDSSGRAMESRASSDHSEADARNRAMEFCRASGGLSCQVADCTEDSNLKSRDVCRK